MLGGHIIKYVMENVSVTKQFVHTGLQAYQEILLMDNFFKSETTSIQLEEENIGSSVVHIKFENYLS